MQQNNKDNENSQNEKYILKGMLAELGEHLDQAGVLFAEINKRINSLKSDEKEDSISDSNTIKLPSIPSIPIPSIPTIPQIGSPLGTSVEEVDDLYDKCTFKVGSKTSSDKTYEINYHYATCTCPHFKYSGPLVCKHLKDIYDKPGNYRMQGNYLSQFKQMCDKMK